MKNIFLKIKRAETPLYRALNQTANWLLQLRIPSIRIIHYPLYQLTYQVKAVFFHIIHLVWSVPLFSARCEQVGKGLHLPNGIPYVVGSHLKIYLGENVTILRSTIGAGKKLDSPELRIGNNTVVGYGTSISCAKKIAIGDNCLIAPHCSIMDNDDHPINPAKRLAAEPVEEKDIKPVIIGNNVWIGEYCSILKGVTIGDNSVIATHSVISRDVAPNCVYAGYPARPTMRNIDKL